MRPLLRELRAYGPQNGLIYNQAHHSLIKLPRTNYKSYAENFIPLNYFIRQYRKNMVANAKLFLKNDFHVKAGLKRVIESFYSSISDNSPLPISHREILLTTKIMDSIFAHTCR